MATYPPIHSRSIFLHATSVALIANGAIHDYPFIASLINTYEYLIAVDGGLKHCQEMKLTPSLIIGDFDSIPPDLIQHYKNVPCEKFSADKDESDMELALRASNTPSIKKIGIFGALEKRTDHTLSNLHLLCRHPDIVVIETENETLFAAHTKHKIHCFPGQTVSFIPFGQANGVTTKGLKWEMQNASLDKQFMSLSNICLTSEFEIEVVQGDLICILKRKNSTYS